MGATRSRLIVLVAGIAYALAVHEAKAQVNTPQGQVSRLEVRLAETQPGQGYLKVAVQNSDRQIYVHDERIIGNDDVLQARVVEENGHFNIAVTLTADGAGKMAAATEAHTGRPLAIILNGEVIAAPTVRSRVTNQALLTGDFSRADAERIAAGLKK